MTSMHVRNARKAATDFVKQARERITNARERAEEIRGSSVYTPDGKEELAGGWAAEARKAVASAVERAHTRAAEARRKAEGKLKKSRTVSESDRSTASTTLLPLIHAAAGDPTVLVRAYERRAADSLADRIILEESIEACIAGGLGGATFVEDWQRTRNALADAAQSDEEHEAVADLVAVDALETYIGAAETELETAAEESGGISDDFVPQEIPESVRRDTEARRAAMARVSQ